MSAPTFTLDIKGFEAMARELSKLSGHAIPTVIRLETAKVIDLCIKRTPTAKDKAINRTMAHVNAKFNTFAGDSKVGQKDEYITGTAYQSATTAGRYVSVTAQGKYLVVNGIARKMQDASGARAGKRKPGGYEVFLALEAQRQAIRGAAMNRTEGRLRASVGVSQLSWIQMAQDLGVEGLLKNGKKARNAVPTNGRQVKNGFGREVAGFDGFYIEIRNTSPVTLARGKGQQVLEGAIKTRVNAFGIELHKGVFEDLKTRAQRYPGIFVT